jgi:excisionase family DNA binding protein
MTLNRQKPDHLDFLERTGTVTGSTARQPEIQPKWYTTRQVALMLGYSLTKTKHLILSGQIRSIKDGGNRRILAEHVDEYIARKTKEA